MNEDELIRRLKHGERKVLEAMIDKYKNYVYTIVFQILKNTQLAEEVTQDVFIKVYQKINTFEERSKFSTWLFTITYRLALNLANKRNITIPESDFLIDGNTDLSFTDISGDQTSIGSDFAVTESADTREKQNILWNAIDRLHVQQGLIISLFYLQQFTVSEIAEVMQISVNTVKTQLFRGRNNLRKMLLSQYTEEDLL